MYIYCSKSRYPVTGFFFLFLSVLFFIGVSSVCRQLFAQTPAGIYGTITDSRGIPLAGAHISVADRQTGSVSGWDGSFVLHDLPPGTYTLVVTYLGYTTSTRRDVAVHEGTPTRVYFQLSSDYIERPLVVIRGTVQPQILNRSQMAVINRKQWESSVAGTIGDVLRDVPGVTVLEGDGSQRISLRGSPPRTVRVDLDGIPLNDAGTGAAELKYVDLDQLESIRIEFEGIGGKVHLQSRNFGSASQNNPDISASIANGSYGRKESRLGAGGYKNNVNGYLHYVQKVDDGDFKYKQEDGTTRYRINNESSSISGIGSGKYSTDSYRLEGGVYYEEVSRGIPGLIREPPTPEANLSTDRLSARLAGKGSVGLLFWNVTGFLSRYTSLFSSPGIQYNPENGSFVHHAAERNRQTGVRFGLNGSSVVDQSQGKLRFAYSYQHDRYRGEDLLHDRVTIGGVGLGYAARSLNKAELSIQRWGEFTGVHYFLNPVIISEWIYDEGGGHYRSASPSINAALVKSFRWCSLNLNTGWGRSISAPPFNALFLIENTFAVGNKDLKAERGECLNIGMNLSSSTETDVSWRVGVSHTRSITKDLIIWRRNFHGKYYPDNVDRTRSRRIEITALTSLLNGAISVSANYINNHSVNDTPGDINYGKLIPLIAGKRGSTSLVITHKGTSFRLSGRWIGRRYSTESNLDPMSTAERGLPPYEVYDLSFSREHRIKAVLLTGELGIDNLSDRSYRVVERSPMPGRTYMVKLKLEI